MNYRDSKIPDELAKTDYVEAMVRMKLIPYILTVISVPSIIKATAETFEKEYKIDNNTVKIEAALIGGSSVDSKKISFATEISGLETNDIIKRYGIKTYGDLDDLMKSFVYPPGDLDWIIITDQKLDSAEEEIFTNKEIFAKKLKRKASKIPRALSKINPRFHHDFSSQSITDITNLSEYLTSYSSSKPREKNHILEIPHNSVVVCKEGSFKGCDSTLEKIRKETSNPRTLREYEKEVTELYKEAKKKYDVVEVYAQEL